MNHVSKAHGTIELIEENEPFTNLCKHCHSFKGQHTQVCVCVCMCARVYACERERERDPTSFMLFYFISFILFYKKIQKFKNYKKKL